MSYLVKAIICYLSSVLFLWLPTNAQTFSLNSDLRFDNYNVNNNFSCDFVLSILRSSDGYVWAACNGLYRFDGVKYTFYSNSNNDHHQLRNNYISDLVEDDYGRIWVGNGGGLCYFDKKNEQFHYIMASSACKVEQAFALCILKDKLWFISNLGLTYLHLETLQLEYIPGNFLKETITVCAIDSNTLLCSGNNNKYYTYNVNNKKLEPRQLGKKATPITGLTRMNGKMWMSTFEGIWTTDDDNKVATFIKGTERLNISDMVSVPALTGDSILWLGTERSGLVLYNINTNAIVHSFTHDINNLHSIGGNEINKIFVDDKSLVWLATDNGISLVNHSNQFFKEYSMPDKYVLDVVQDKFAPGNVWLSIYRKGLLKINWRTKKALQSVYSLVGHNPEKSPGSSIYDMLQLNKDTWLLLSMYDLSIWNSKTHKNKILASFPIDFNMPKLRLRNLVLYNSDSCFVTSNNGLYLCHIPSGKIDTVLLRHNSETYSDLDITNGSHDGKGNLWLATRSGLLNYNIITRHKRTYRVDSSHYLGNFMSKAAIDARNKRIFCATAGGVAVFDIATRRFRFFDKFNDIKYPACGDIFIKDSIAWINSNQGLINLNIYNWTSNITISDQKSVSVLPFSFVNNEVVLSIRNMYSYFTPELINSPLPSKPVIEQITINGQLSFFPINAFSSSLKYDQNNVSFRYTAFEYNDPKHIKYRYKLKGLSDEWVYASDNREANYMHLPPGDYTFILQAGNRRGNWNRTTTSLSFSITPPYWQTLWFRSTIVLSFIGLVTGIGTIRVRAIKKREVEKTAFNKSMAEMEMQVLLNHMNPHFIFNSLNSIQKFIWENKQEDAAEYLVKFSRLIRMILDNSVQKRITLEQELDALSLYLELEHRRCNNKFDYLIHVDQESQTKSILFPALLLQPYVENAIWHGLINKEGRGTLKIIVTAEDNDMIRCIIEDNGIGRVASAALREKKSASYGMQITKQRLEIMNINGKSGKIDVEDLYDETGAGTGTKITIHVPFSTFVKV